jgi:hypothetical protein
MDLVVVENLEGFGDFERCFEEFCGRFRKIHIDISR